MGAEPMEEWIGVLDAHLTRVRCRRVDARVLAACPQMAAAWVRKTIFRNVGIALVPVPSGVGRVGAFATGIKMSIGQALGFREFWRPLGLQMILAGPGAVEASGDMEQYLASEGTMAVTLQSVHAVDPAARLARSVKAWCRLGSGKFVKAIEAAIGEFIAPRARAMQQRGES